MAQTSGAVKRVKKGVNAVFPDLAFSTKDVYNAVSLLALIFALYAALYLAIGPVFLPPGGAAWAIVFVWFTALLLGMIVDRFMIPAPLGMIVAGIILRNVHDGHIISGLRSSWTREFRGIALAVIFLRSGLELDLGIFKRVGPAATRLLFIPGIIEAFFDGGLAISIFKMPATFAFALGFILKAVGPALVIQCMFEVQQKRLGLDKAIPATVVAAASFDDAIAITGYTIFINVAVTGNSGNQVWQIMHGPLSIVFGILAGLVAALICAPTKLWNNIYKRTTVVFFLALVMKFFFDKYGFTSGGALGSLTLGLVVKELWSRGWPSWAANEDHGPHLSRSVEKHIRWFWRFFMCPLLFGIIGTQMNFKGLPDSIVPKSIAIVVAGLAVRAPLSFLSMTFSGFTFKEKLFFAFAWTPKATVQATLAALPMDQVNRLISRSDPRFADYQRYAQDALVTGIICILICGSIGTFLIRWFSPKLLNKSPEPTEDETNNAGEVEEPGHMQRTYSGRYKNPSIDVRPNVQPFGIESRPHQPLSGLDEAVQDDKAYLRQHNHLLADYLEYFESIADEVDLRASRSEDTFLEQTAIRLRGNVHELRQRLVDETGARPSPKDVEGAQAFSRASGFRHRQPAQKQQDITENVKQIP